MKHTVGFRHAGTRNCKRCLAEQIIC